MDNQFDRFSDDAKKSLIYAQEIAVNLGSVIDTAMILWGFLKESDFVAGEMLNEAGATPEKVQELVVPGQKIVSVMEARTGLSYQSQKILEASVAFAHRVGDTFVGTEHILFSIVNQENSEGVKILNKIGVSVPVITAKLEDYFREESGNLSDYPGDAEGPKFRTNNGRNSKESLLDQFSTNITRRQKKEN